MPYPVLPPELPPIIQSVPIERLAHSNAASTASVGALTTPSHKRFSGGSRSLSVATEPKIASEPETFPPEDASPGLATSASTLGNPVSVGLPLAEISPSLEASQIPPAHAIKSGNSTSKSKQPSLTPTAPSAGTLPPGWFVSQAQPGNAAPTPADTTVESSPPIEVIGAIELTADRQTYDNESRILTAEGNVAMRFQNALLKADRLRVNLVNRLAVAEGNVLLTRGEQVLLGERFEYNFVQGTGTIFQAKGEIYIPTTGSDFGSTLPTTVSSNTAPATTLSERLLSKQPPEQVSSPGNVSVNVGVGRDAPPTRTTGELKRIRYEAERIDFDTKGWVARNIRVTNDPFSPPELELRADQAQLTQISPEEGLLETSEPRLVFDQGLSVPFLVSRSVIGRRQRESGLLQFGYDRTDRGGLYVEQTFEPISSEQFQFSFTPQVFLQRIAEGGNVASATSYGLRTQLNYILGPRTSIVGSAVLTNLDVTQVETSLRASVRARQLIGTHSLALEYSYRDRLFNGSLGFQEVQSSLGAVLTSPAIELGNTGIYASYQTGFQYINAETDRQNLLAPVRTNDRINLSRIQAALSLSNGLVLWRGESLPPTPTAGLRYTAQPLVPYIRLFTGIDGVVSAYSSGDTQETLTGTIGLEGQFGNFSKPFLDYTAFNISYSQTAISGLSPFLFDRSVDTKVLTGGIIQQLYGPFRIGFQTSINLDTNRAISTDYILEYSRRTYGLILRYNPVLQVGSLGLRISDFNWTGGAEPFTGTGIRTVERGVRQSNE